MSKKNPSKTNKTSPQKRKKQVRTKSNIQKHAPNLPKKAPRKQNTPGLRKRFLTFIRASCRKIFVIIYRFLRWPMRIIWAIFWRASTITILMWIVLAGYYYVNLPDISTLIDARMRGSVIMKDINNDVFAWRGDHFSQKATPQTISFHLKNAIIATEDKRFYKHFGVSPRGIAGAIRINLKEGRGALSGHGGSTITQQTAKILCLGVAYDSNLHKNESSYEAQCRRSNIWRKIKETAFAAALEIAYSKDEILTIYLNRVFLGAHARGVEAAAQRYFNKSAADLSSSESAMIAGLLVAPSYYAPTNNLTRAHDRAKIVLSLMHQQGYLSAEQYQIAKANPARLASSAQTAMGNDFADWIMMTLPGFLGKNTTEDVTIQTSFNPEIQKATQEAIDHIFKSKVRPDSRAQIAVIVMTPDGAVRALVGGRKIDKTKYYFNRAVQALRQPGSAFKPFVYAAALEAGHSPLSTVLDAPVNLEIAGNKSWAPRNYTRTFQGEVTLVEALRDSLNIPAVIVSEHIGRDKIISLAHNFDLGTEIPKVPAIALGTLQTTLIRLTSAYTAFVNQGVKHDAWGIEEIWLKDSNTPIISRKNNQSKRIISADTARQITFMLADVIANGTGKNAAFDLHDIAGKTGTTQAARDAWFIGFSAHYIAGVWMGYDDNTPLTQVTGGGLPADIWREIMTRIHRTVPPRALDQAIPHQQITHIGPKHQNPNDRQDKKATKKGLARFFDRLFGKRQQDIP